MESSERDAVNPDTTSITAPTKTAKRKSASGKKRTLVVRPHYKDGGELKSCRLEAGLHQYYGNCAKNLHHATFIPSDKFMVEKHPWCWQGVDLDILLPTYLYVAVTVKYVSERRPRTEAVSGTPYPGYPYSGELRTTMATGCIHSVHMFPDKYNSQFQTCPCQDCGVSSTPVRQFAFVAIYTTAHLVFDDHEGKHCTCRLLCKRRSIPDTSEGVVQLTGMWRVFPATSTDRCLMIHVTHDMDLAARLDKMASHHYCLNENYINECLLSGPPNVALTEEDSPVCLVSHPHGYSSNIIVDVPKGSQVNMAGGTHYMYETPTCPGSSGGNLFLEWKDYRMWGLEHTHSGGRHQGGQLNYSSYGVGSLPLICGQVGSQETDSPGKSEVEQEQQGPAEVEECFPDTDLHKRLEECKKNSGHKNFTLMHQFSDEDLPPDHRHLVKPIKALGKITALVDVKHVSTKRTKTFPGSNKPYPRTPHRGTAWVYKVLRFPNISKFMEKCTCKECQISGDSKTEFAYIIIHTAAHVVFNEFEGEHTTCYLFYDEGNREYDCKGVVKLSGMSRVWSDAEKDVCKMLYVTHDPDVIDRVEKAVKEWESARKSLELMDKIKSTSLQGSPSTGASHQSLAIMVSHPHGCSQRVSIGHCVSTYEKGNGQTVCTYTTPTCPGCSGAYVFVVGRGWQSGDAYSFLR